MATILDRLIIQLSTDVNTRGLDGVQAKLNGLANRAAMVGLAISAVGVGVGKSFVDVSRGWTTFAASTGRDIGELKNQYGDFVSSISREAGIGQERVLATLQKIISAGVEGAEAVGLATAAIKAERLRVSGAEELASAATTLTTVFDDLSNANAADLVVRVGQVGEGSIADFAPSIKSLALMAETAGLSERSMGALLAMSSRVAPSVSEGSTMIQGLLAAIMQAVPGTVLAFDKLGKAAGISFEDVQNAMRGDDFVSALDLIDRAVGDQAAAVFRRREALMGLAALRDQRDLLAELSADFQGASGTINTAWDDALASDPSIKLDQSMQSLRGVAISIGSHLVPQVATAGESLAGFLDHLDGADGGAAKLMARALLLGPALLGLAAVLKITAWTIGAYSLAWRAASAAMIWARSVSLGTRLALAALAVQGMVLKGATLLMAGAQWALNAAMLANPIVWIIAGIAALAVGAFLLIKHWDKVAAWFREGFLGGILAGLERIGQAFARLRGAAGELKRRIGGAMGEVDAGAIAAELTMMGPAGSPAMAGAGASAMAPPAPIGPPARGALPMDANDNPGEGGGSGEGDGGMFSGLPVAPVAPSGNDHSVRSNTWNIEQKVDVGGVTTQAHQDAGRAIGSGVARALRNENRKIKSVFDSSIRE